MRMLLSGIDTIDCAYYLRPGTDGRLDFAALAQIREAQLAAKRSEPVTVSLLSFP